MQTDYGDKKFSDLFSARPAISILLPHKVYMLVLAPSLPILISYQAGWLSINSQWIVSQAIQSIIGQGLFSGQSTFPGLEDEKLKTEARFEED